MNHAA